MNSDIFRAYDVRGVVGTDLTREVVRALGVAIADAASRAGGDEVAVGRDCRTHSEEVSGWLAEGILAGGVDVRDIGMGPTPALYFAAADRHGVMVTGSHNPPEYNGFKLVIGGGALHGTAIAQLKTATAEALAHPPDAPATPEGPRRIDDGGAQGRYVAAIAEACAPGDLTVVVDAGNGAAGPAAVAAYRALGHRVVELYCDPDGRFPNHHPDPSLPENVADLRRRVCETGADLGLAFDGDGDRLGVVDHRGRMVAADRVGAVLARRILAERPGATILGEVKCSDVFFDDVRRHGGVAEMGQVGHSLVKDAMRRTGAVFAAELSGHMFFADRWHGFDDAVYAGARVLELAGEGDGGFAAQMEDLPHTHATPELRVDCPDDLKFEVVAGVLAWARGVPEAEIVTLDGVRLRVPGGWGLVRASNTQPALVLRVEGDTPARRDAIVAMLADALRERGLTLGPVPGEPG